MAPAVVVAVGELEVEEGPNCWEGSLRVLVAGRG